MGIIQVSKWDSSFGEQNWPDHKGYGVEKNELCLAVNIQHFSGWGKSVCNLRGIESFMAMLVFNLHIPL